MIISKMELEDLSKIEPVLAEEFDDFWSINMLKEELENETREYIIAKENDKIVGFAGISKASDVVEIMNIVVRKSNRRLGIGKALLDELTELAKKTNLDILTLEVNCNNISARKLYEKNGFEVVRVRKKYYSNKDDAIIMNLRLKSL